MGRKRKAWLVGGNGVYTRAGNRLPGYYVRWNEPTAAGTVKRSRTFNQLADAKSFVRRKNALIDLQGTGQIVPVPLSAASQEFLESMSAAARGTLIQYTVSIQALMRCLGDVDVSGIGPREIDRFIAERMAEASQATAAKHLRQIKRFLRWCMSRGYLAADPTAAVTSRPRNVSVRARPHVTDQQFAAILAAIDTEDRRLGVLLAATTGLDRGVIARLLPADIDLERKQIRTVRIKTHSVVAPFLHDDLVPAIRRKIADGRAESPLFPGLSRQSKDRDWWHAATKAAGVEGLLFRDLRSLAANWLRQAIGDFGAQKVLGHSSPAVTSRHYHTLDPAAQSRISGQSLPGSPAHRAKAKKPKAKKPSGPRRHTPSAGHPASSPAAAAG